MIRAISGLSIRARCSPAQTELLRDRAKCLAGKSPSLPGRAIRSLPDRNPRQHPPAVVISCGAAGMKITNIVVRDIRFPTSLQQDGSDALNQGDYIAVSGSLENRLCEYVDHLHEHFVDPCIVKNARYTAPLRPGYSIDIKPESIAEYEFPAGRFWKRAEIASQ